MTSDIALQMRTIVRSTGFSKRAVRWMRRRGYEQALTSAMKKVVTPGAVVWDVGANIGFYSTQFADWCGAGGQVYAFEPDASNADRLRQAVRGYANVEVVEAGLSDQTGSVPLHRGDHPDGATFRLADPGEESDVSVEVTTGDELVARGVCKIPNVIKMDIEGHELEALEGMQQTIRHADCRNIFIEVHFFLHARKQRSDVPRRIERLLVDSGFKVGWIDQSHIHARKPGH